MEKNINIQQVPFFYFLEKTRPKKQNAIINISHLIIVLIKMRLLIFFVFSRYGLACKYGIIFQVSVYHWMQNFIFLIPGTTTANQKRL